MAPARYLLMVGVGGDGGRHEAVWRLVGRNNRDLGRSPQGYPHVAGCLAAIDGLRDVVQDGELSFTAAPGDGWRWTLRHSGMPLAVSARAYQRQRECQFNAQQFLASAATAQPLKRLRVLRDRAAEERLTLLLNARVAL